MNSRRGKTKANPSDSAMSNPDRWCDPAITRKNRSTRTRRCRGNPIHESHKRILSTKYTKKHEVFFKEFFVLLRVLRGQKLCVFCGCPLALADYCAPAAFAASGFAVSFFFSSGFFSSFF